MKIVFFLVSLIASYTFAQQGTNGTISLVFNGEKISLPISKVSIKKDNSILLSIKAEIQDSSIQQRITIQLGLRELSSETKVEILEDTRIEISTRNNKTNSGKQLSFWFANQSGNNKNKSEVAYYGIISGGEKISWEINSISMKIDFADIQYKNGALHINGEFYGVFKSKWAPEGQEAEIKDGKFEIII